MNSIRSSCGAATINGCIIVAGGQSERLRGSSSVQKYDPIKNELSPMNEARKSFALVNSIGFLYAMGDGKPAEKYDPSNGKWYGRMAAGTSNSCSRLLSFIQ